MSSLHLSDLDELVLRCRDNRARSQIAEAVACYRAGAYRACIVLTWIAVVFDLLGKLSELDLYGDRRAGQVLDDFRKWRENSDVIQLQNFERTILATVGEKFELFTSIELEDLERLRVDRNRCAHPTLNVAEDEYLPTSELARYHLTSAVNHLLSLAPVQGKAARDEILREVRSEYFPTNIDRAVQHFQTGPLDRPTIALTRNSILLLLKYALHEDIAESERLRHLVGIQAIARMHPAISEEVLAESLPKEFRRLEDDRLSRFVAVLAMVPSATSAIGSAEYSKLNEYLRLCELPDESAAILDAIAVPGLAQAAQMRLGDVSLSALIATVRRHPSVVYTDAVVHRFANASSFRQAEQVGRDLVLPIVSYLNIEQLQRILEAFPDNRQIWDANGMPTIMVELFKATQDHADKLQAGWAVVYQKADSDLDPSETRQLRQLLENRFPDFGVPF